jgi:pyruvate dehydrogenase E2 component (dihydrolipoamide acetyltransferase)
VFAAPSVRKFAREVGVDLSRVTGTGAGGRITTDDVKSYARSQPSDNGAGAAISPPPLPDFAAHGEVDVQPMSMIARKTAEHMALCWALIPHVTLHESVDVTDLEAFRQANKDVAERAGGRLTITAILVKLVAQGLKEFPILNASVDTANRQIIYKKYIHIGVAVDTPRGLVVPPVRHADRMNLVKVCVALGDLAERAREGKLALEELTGGTFTITNLGGIGVGNFSPIVNWPEVAILGVGKAEPTAVETSPGQYHSRLMMPISLSFDHRVVNGADGARFLQWLKRAIEQPLSVLVDA